MMQHLRQRRARGRCHEPSRCVCRERVSDEFRARLSARAQPRASNSANSSGVSRGATARHHAPDAPALPPSLQHLDVIPRGGLIRPGRDLLGYGHPVDRLRIAHAGSVERRRVPGEETVTSPTLPARVTNVHGSRPGRSARADRPPRRSLHSHGCIHDVVEVIVRAATNDQPDGTPGTKRGFVRKREAEPWLPDVETSRARGSFIDPQASRATIDDLGPVWREAKRHSMTPSSYAPRGSDHLAHVPESGRSVVQVVHPVARSPRLRRVHVPESRRRGGWVHFSPGSPYLLKSSHGTHLRSPRCTQDSMSSGKWPLPQSCRSRASGSTRSTSEKDTSTS